MVKCRFFVLPLVVVVFLSVLLCSTLGIVNDPVEYWSFTEGSGTSVASSGSQASTLTMSEASWSASGYSGNCYSNGGTGYASNATCDNPFGGSFSITFWLNPINSTLSQYIYGSGSNFFAEIYSDNLKVIKTADGQVWDWIGQSVVVGEWQFLALVYNGTDMNLYYNGTWVDSNTQTTADSNGFFIGKHPDYGFGYYNGSLDEFRIFSRALTSSEVLELYTYNGPEPTPTPTPTATATAAPSGDTETEAERLKYQMSWLLFALAVVSIVVIVLPWRLWLLRVGLGLFVIVIAGAGVFRLSNWWDIMFAPWLQIAVIFLGVVLIFSSFARRD